MRKTRKSPTKTYGLTHLAIAVKDLDRTLKFYTHIFDMEVMYHEDKMIQLTTPGNHDILVFEKKEGPLIGQSGGIAHFGFRLKDPRDIEEIHDRIWNRAGRLSIRVSLSPARPTSFSKIRMDTQ